MAAQEFDFDAAIRELKFVDSGLSASRGMYFISSYKPNAALRKKGLDGLVEFHQNYLSDDATFELYCRIKLQDGSEVKLKERGGDKQALFEKFKSALVKKA